MLVHQKILLVCFGAVLLLCHGLALDKAAFNSSPKEQKEKSVKLPPCKSCTVLVNSFKLGLDKTSRGKHAGGDAAWEEEKLRSYKSSEVRLVEIQEKLCTEVKRGRDHCHTMANDHEHLMEDWFLHKQTEHPDLHVWLCIEQLQLCCPAGQYGAECKQCSECSGNGKCKGDGTRKGNGKCACDTGYAGADCNQCAENYYESFRDATKLLCSKCHVSCGESGCTGAGPQACHKCEAGWRMETGTGCHDVNECIDLSRPCKQQQFCVNNEGSFACLECDRSCDRCDGDGPDMCKKCADGYKLKDGKCQDMPDVELEKEIGINLESSELDEEYLQDAGFVESRNEKEEL